MARTNYRPGRNLVVFLLGVAVMFGLVALAGTWKPALGLDLQGGTRITLTARGNPSESQLEQARKIIDQRVNGSGVAESEVITQDSKYVIVEIPGESRRDLIETVQRQARLSFRLIACSDTSPGACGAGTNPLAPAGSAGRPAPAGLLEDDPAATTTPSPSTSPSPTPTPTGSVSPTPTTSGTATPGATQAGDVDAALMWRSKPPAEWIAKYQAATCPIEGERTDEFDDPNLPVVTCDENNIKYLLSSAVVEGDELDKASAEQEQNSLEWVVSLRFKDAGAKAFGKVSQTLFNNNREQFAIVLDGDIISAPSMDDPGLSRSASINGSSADPMSQAEANKLATALKYGALPISFDDKSTVETVGPSLAGDQLTAGLTAGAIGLGLVMLYCLLYYRGLGIVVLASLAVAAAATYALVLLLSKTAGFTLTLPGIAGLIIAVGITADSFIIFFERIRDEMREGKSMRVAVETGWARARKTRIAASVVSLLSALILYIFATGVVKGFGFALGLSTLVDLAVLFWFTKPFVSFLARYTFFNGGGRLSGLSPETLGTDVAAVGGKA